MEAALACTHVHPVGQDGAFVQVGFSLVYFSLFDTQTLRFGTCWPPPAARGGGGGQIFIEVT